MDANPNKRPRTEDAPAQPVAGPSSALQDSISLLSTQQQSTVLRQLLNDPSTSARTKLYVSRALEPPQPTSSKPAMNPVLEDKIKAIQREISEAVAEVDREWPEKRRENMPLEYQEIFERNDANDEEDDDDLFEDNPSPGYPDALCDLIPSILELRLSLPSGPRAAFKLLLELTGSAFPGEDAEPPLDTDDFCNDIDNAMLHVLQALAEVPEGLDFEKDRTSIEKAMQWAGFDGLEFQSSLEYLDDGFDTEGGEEDEEKVQQPLPRGFTDGEVVELVDTDEEDDGEIVCLS